MLCEIWIVFWIKILTKSFRFEKWVTLFWLPSILTPTLRQKPSGGQRKINRVPPSPEKEIIFYGRGAPTIQSHLQDPARSACQPTAYPVLARLATLVGRTVSCQWCDDPCLRTLDGRSPHCCPRSSDSVRRPANSESCSLFHACCAVSRHKCIAAIYRGDRLTKICVCDSVLVCQWPMSGAKCLIKSFGIVKDSGLMVVGSATIER